MYYAKELSTQEASLCESGRIALVTKPNLTNPIVGTKFNPMKLNLNLRPIIRIACLAAGALVLSATSARAETFPFTVTNAALV